MPVPIVGSPGSAVPIIPGSGSHSVSLVLSSAIPVGQTFSAIVVFTTDSGGQNLLAGQPAQTAVPFTGSVSGQTVTLTYTAPNPATISGLLYGVVDISVAGVIVAAVAGTPVALGGITVTSVTWS